MVEEYVLGMLEGAEKAAFEARLATDAQLAQRVREAQAVLSDVALSTPVALPPSLKQRVMAGAVPVAVPAAPAADPVVLPIRRPGTSRGTVWLGLALAASLVLIVKQSRDLGRQLVCERRIELLLALGQRRLVELDQANPAILEECGDRLELLLGSLGRRIDGERSRASHRVAISPIRPSSPRQTRSSLLRRRGS